MNQEKKKILIVDDMPANIRVLWHVLHPDYQIFFALNGNDALGIISIDPPDLVLLDIVMPGMDGFSVCEKIKQNKDTQHLPVIFTTGKTEESVEARGLAMGAVDFITKPFNPLIVKSRIKMHMELAQAYSKFYDQENRLQVVLDNVVDAVITTDTEGRVLNFNLAAEKIFGFDKEVAQGKHIFSLIVRPDWVEQPPGEMRLLVQYMEKHETLTREFFSSGMMSDGSNAALSVTLVGSRKFGYITFSFFIREVTERRVLLDSLNQTLMSAEESSRAKCDFFTNLSHEIRTPMNAIVAFTELALESESITKVKIFLKKIKRSSSSMLSVINDILNFSLLDSGNIKLTPVVFHLCDVFVHMNDLFLRQATEKGIELHWFLPDDFPPLMGDVLRLEQVLTNLISNAVKFTNSGVIVFKAGLREQISQRVVVEFTVQDSGIGIDPVHLKGLFEPFFQADSSITRRYSGTGLGLAICKRILDIMGGQIWVESQEGQGSTFHFTSIFDSILEEQRQAIDYVPITDISTDISIEERLKGVRVLVVEDDSINRQVIRELLERVNVIVDEAVHGGVALRMLKTTRYDLILMDIQMPEMDGLTATSIIRGKKQFDSLPIVAISAHVTEKDREKFLHAGMNDHVGKPINLRDMYLTLSKWVNLVFPSDDHLFQSDKENSLPFPELSGVDTEAGLRSLSGNIVLYNKLLIQMHEEYAQVDVRIKHALNNNDYAMAERLAHTIKGIAGQLGAYNLYRSVKKLEEAIVDKSMQIDMVVNEFSESLEYVMKSISNMPRQSNTETVFDLIREVDNAKLAPMMQSLAVLLYDKDANANDMIERLCMQLQDPTLRKLSNLLREKIKKYDYESSLCVLSEIAAHVKISLECKPHDSDWVGLKKPVDASCGQKVLIIDDDPIDVSILRSILEPICRLYVAINGKIGLKYVQEHDSLDLVILDVMMPEMDGFDVCRQLKENPVTRGVPVIFITGKNKVEDQTKAFRFGAVDYISKPFNASIVKARVTNHLAMHAAHQLIEKQYTSLQEMDRLRKDMEAVSRHDLKTPINGIIACTDLLLQDGHLPQSDIEHIYRLIRDSSRQLREQVNMSFNLINMENGRYKIRLVPVSILPILNRILSDNRILINRKKIDILITVDSNPVLENQEFIILGDETLCYTMIANLLKNALEASGSGQQVSIAMMNGKIATIAIHNKRMVPKAVRDKFFEKYVTHGKRGGTGLGTYSSRLMAETQGGSVSMYTSRRDGTTVTIFLKQ